MPTEATIPVGWDELEELQLHLAALTPAQWTPSEEVLLGGCFVCFERGGRGSGAAGDRGWTAAVTMRSSNVLCMSVVEGKAGAPYAPGFLTAREGNLLASAVNGLTRRPEVLLVNATGRDHPRRAGLALHIGWALDVPSVGVTDRPLVGRGEEPEQERGDRAPLELDGEQLGWWVRTRRSARPLVVSPGWRTDLETAWVVVMKAVRRARTPEPIRQARRLARTARARGVGSAGEGFSPDRS
jgi:deoxyribonuclease V